MFSRRLQQRARQLVAFLIRPLARFGITPNMLTYIGMALSIVTALVIAQGYMIWGGLLILFAGIFDMFDGAMARVSNTSSTFGAFLDSTLDRYSEGIILFGLLFYALQHPDLQNALWSAPHEQLWMISFVYIAVVGSLMVSYTKARAEGLGIECKTGLLARPERVILLAIGLLTNTGIWALALLAVFSNITAVERMVTVWRNTRQSAVKRDIAYQQQQQEDTSTNECQSLDLTGPNEDENLSSSDVRPVHTNVPPFNGGVQQE
ncbi:MAG TPA: CDP-alcohol phosphatidyltransferase family protein [Dictyobacter sp.]|nr:CDP-alcohol phosphatidyltransferase family protein [Dictyobacter sp.]